MNLSIIVPVYEDREACVALVPQIVRFGEVVVVDASRVDPVQREDLPEGVVLIRSERASRAVQMNLGVAHSVGSEILFLHADTVLSGEGFASLARVWEEVAVVGGGFARRFDSQSPLLRFTCWLAEWRGRWLGWFLGDQAIFVRRSVFEEVGEYRPLRVFEDYDLCRRLKKRGTMRCLGPPVRTSARRFRGGMLRRVIGDFWLTVVYLVRGSGAFLGE